MGLTFGRPMAFAKAGASSGNPGSPMPVGGSGTKCTALSSMLVTICDPARLEQLVRIDAAFGASRVRWLEVGSLRSVVRQSLPDWLYKHVRLVYNLATLAFLFEASIRPTM